MPPAFAPHNPTAHLQSQPKDSSCCDGDEEVKLNQPVGLEDQIMIYDLKFDPNTLKVTNPASAKSPSPSSSSSGNNLSSSLTSKSSASKSLEDTLSIINDLSQYLGRAPFPHCPPSPQMIQDNNRSQQINQIKEEGNLAFKSNNFKRAVELYSAAAEVAATRPLFEPSIVMREELSVILCNRAAAYSSLKMWNEALCDSDAVIQLKRNWSKGHFRKAKALQGLNLLVEAQNAALLGLEFEPDNTDLQAALNEIVGLRKSSS